MCIKGIGKRNNTTFFFSPYSNQSTATNNATTANSNSQLNAPEWALSALKHSTDFGAKLITYQHYQSNAADIISSSNLSNEQKFSSFVDFQKKNATLIPDQCTLPKCGVNVQNLPKVAKTMTNENVDKLQKDVLNSLADVKKIHGKQFYTHINSCFCGYNRS